MEVGRASFFMVLVVFSLIFAMAQANSAAPAPSPTNDGMSIDQAVAYVLMLIALVLTYLIH